MKKYVSLMLALVLAVALAACASESAPTKPTKQTVPSVVGESVSSAIYNLNRIGLSGEPVGTSGEKLSSNDFLWAKVLSQDPAPGTLVDQIMVTLKIDPTAPRNGQSQASSASPAPTATMSASRYLLDCGDAQSEKFHSYTEVWTSYDKTSAYEACHLDIGGADAFDDPPPALIPAEQAIVDVVKSKGGDGAWPAATFDTVYRLCAAPPTNYVDDVSGNQAYKKADAAGALALCPDAPHASLFHQVIDSTKLGDGTYTVGKTMPAGTYRTEPGVKTCYWSRSNGDGQIIANDLVDFAPDGVTVTVYAGEGFDSERCGTWTKIG